MRTFNTLALAASILGAAQAIKLVEKRDDGQPLQVVQQDIQRRQVADPVARDRRRMERRASKVVAATLVNEETLYFMNGSLGTPAQNFRLHIDTGSSDLWVNVANSQFCEQSGNQCGVSGTYDANSSSTYKYINSDFNISYVDGTGSAGDYVSDTFSFSGVTLENYQFGIGYTSSSQQGVLGIGYPSNEVAVAYNGGQSYPNVPQHLQQSGQINTNAYSLWLNDLDASTGSILFGGVNTDKFTGQLQTLPIIKTQGVYTEFIIALTALGANGTEGSLASNQAIPVLLDSGSSLMYIPDDLASSVYDAVGASYDQRQGVAFIDCDMQYSKATVDFTFSSPTISVGLDELIFLAGQPQGQDVCIIGVMPAGDSQPVLGDTFLRSAYVVYDLDNNEISLAQTSFNSSSDNIQEISSSTGVPDATPVANAVTNVAVSSGGPREPNAFTRTVEAAAQPTAAAGYNLALLGAGAGLMLAL